MPQTLEIISRLPETNLVKNDDVVALICLKGKVITAINTRDSKGILKVWRPTPDFHLLYEFVAHDCPIYHMAAGEDSHFFTSASDSTVTRWVEADDHCEQVSVLGLTTEPAWRLHYNKEEHRLYSGDSTGEVRIWDARTDELLGSLGTVEEVWDMLVSDGVLFTTRHLDVYLTTLKTKGALGQVVWGIKNTIEGTGPLYIEGQLLALIARRTYDIQIHSLQEQGNPRLATLKGHDAIVTAMAGNGNGVLYSGGYDAKVIAWCLKSFEKLGEVRVKGYVSAMAVDPESGVLYAGGEDRFICAMKMVES